MRMRAFTLIELLVVIAVIALLIALILPAIGKARESGRQVACLSNQRQIGTALVGYANTYREFTPREAGTSENGRPPEVPAFRGAAYNLAWAFTLRPFLDQRAESSTADAGLADQYRDAPYYRDPSRKPDPHNIHYVNNGLRFTAPNVVSSVSKGPTQLSRYTRPDRTMYLTCFVDDPSGLRWGSWYAGGASELGIAIYYDMWRTSNVDGVGGNDNTTAQRVAAKRHGRGANALFLDGHAAIRPGDELTRVTNWDDGDYRLFGR